MLAYVGLTQNLGALVHRPFSCGPCWTVRIQISLFPMWNIAPNFVCQKVSASVGPQRFGSAEVPPLGWGTIDP